MINVNHEPEFKLKEDIKNSKSVMWIGPHADDELWIGGILGYLTRDRKFDCTIVAFGRNPKFLEGNKQSARFLNNADYIRIPDRIGPLRVEWRPRIDDVDSLVDELTRKGVKDELVRIIREKNPDIIFTFESSSKIELLPSHAACSLIAQQALVESEVNCSFYYALQTVHLLSDDPILEQLREVEEIELDEKLWSYKMKIIEFYSPFYPSLQRVLNDKTYQSSLLRKELFRKGY